MSRIDIKICGLSTPESVDAALEQGATHLGFVFFPKSPRNVAPEKAGALALRAAGRARIVGLFVDPEPAFLDAARCEARLDIIQLHGDETPALVGSIARNSGLETWKAIPVKTARDLSSARAFRGSAHRILYDAKPPKGVEVPGGTGLRIDWTLLSGVDHALPWILAGGLDAHNVAGAIATTSARFVDVSSGVESAPGIKDVDKIAAFCKAVQQS